MEVKQYGQNVRLNNKTFSALKQVKEKTKIPLASFVELAVFEKIERDKIKLK